MSPAASLLWALGLWLTLAWAPLAGDESPASVSRPYRLSPYVGPGERFMQVRLLGTLELEPVDVAGYRLGGLSALAWDKDEEVLYALSDRGYLFHLRPIFESGQLVAVTPLAAHGLRDADGRPLQAPLDDAEAMVVRAGDNDRRGDSRLSVAFEQRIRVADFTPEGTYLSTHRLPDELADGGRYASVNLALEALAEHPTFGLMTGPERPMLGAAGDQVTLYSLAGKSWRYPLYATPNASLVAMEALPDGTLMVLERGYGLMLLPVVISLRRTLPGAGPPGHELAVTTLAVLDTSRGWSVDNFEGLAWHREMKFFMVSDDNFREIQRSLLVYFEVVGDGKSKDSGKFPEFELVHETRR